MIIRKTIIVLLLSIYLAEFGTVMFLNTYYSSHLPSVPDEGSGRIYRMSADRFIVYGTKEEFQRLSLAVECLPLAAIGALIAGILNYKYGDFPSNEYFPAAKTLYRRKSPEKNEPTSQP
jgi:hypothetical protein